MQFPPLANLLFEIASFALAAVVLFKEHKEDPFQRFVFVAAVVATICAELVGVRVAHGYYYSDFLIEIARPHQEGVPLCIALDWGVIIFCLWRLGQRLDVPRIVLPFVFALLALPLDLALDPITSLSKVAQPMTSCIANTVPGDALGLGYWIWCVAPEDNQRWFGVPIGNFVGWYMLVVAFTSCALIAQRRLAGRVAGATTLWLTGLGVVIGTLAIEFGSLYLFEQLEQRGASGTGIFFVLMAIGFVAVLASGNRRSDRRMDWWALLALIGVALCCVLAYVFALSGRVGETFVFAIVGMLVLALVLSLWVMRGWPTRAVAISRLS